jgi:MtN3 and saliva related transmembrane protein
MEFVTAVGLGASCFTGVSLLPQLFKIIKKKEAEDISLGMLLSLFIGLSLWIYYGCLKKDWIIIIANLTSLLINISTTLLSIKYKKNNS